MGDENCIRTLGDYSKPSHEGYRNTNELCVGNNVDPNQHLKDFLKLVDSLDLDSENKDAIGLNAFQQDPSPHRRILLPDSLLNSFHREGPQNFATIS
ncbi:hypothetical protein Tco_1433736 [Tanacetum coccineum]